MSDARPRIGVSQKTPYESTLVALSDRVGEGNVARFQILFGFCWRPCGVPKTRARLSSNSPSQRATTIVARQLPIRFTQVRPISISSSTPKIIATPIGPSPAGRNVFNVANKMTSDARGTAATPFDVSINVSIMVIC